MKSHKRSWSRALQLLALVFGGIVIKCFSWSDVGGALEKVRSYRTVQSSSKVLVVSVRESDRFSVRETLEPRGYTVLVADDAKAGMKIMERQGEQITVIVIDKELPQSNRLLQAARSHYRRTHVLLLNGPRGAAQVSALLINTAVN